jgi:hypothetical protein
MRWAGHVACVGRKEIHIGFGGGKLKTKRPFGNPRHKWKDNIKMLPKSYSARKI